MAIYIDSFNIYEFRGIKNLKLNSLNHVNIIAGDNNSGKTSILEAIALFKNPLDIYNVLKTSRIREDLPYFYTSTLFDSFINMLPQDSLHMSVSASGLIGEVDLDLSGELKTFDLPLDTAGTAFQESVWEALRQIPYGQTVSYKDIAIAINNPKAVRAVGGANNRNPISIITPCHRVIGMNGKLVGYGGGIDAKEYLLNLELANS